jgi:DNA repair photolyase
VSIGVYYVEFLETPNALEYSGARCQHGCAYCFANINKADRTSSVTSAINFLYKKPVTYADALWREGYPICVSNRSDPFSPNNLWDTEALFSHLKDFPNGVFVQTKTNRHCEGLIDVLGPKKAVVFVSVPMLDPNIAKIVEPGAPPPQARLETMARLRRKGYHVIAAINPIERTWLPERDFEALVAELRRIGVWHVYMSTLGLSAHRKKKYSPELRRRLLGADTVGEEAKEDYAAECGKWLLGGGFEVSLDSLPGKSGFNAATKSVFPRPMPLLQDYVNHCYGTLPKGGHLLLRFRDFYEFISDGHPLFRARFREADNATLRAYIIRMSHDLWKAHPRIESLYQLLNIYWNDRESGFGLWGNALFAEAFGNGRLMVDGQKNPILYFNGDVQAEDRKEVM